MKLDELNPPRQFKVGSPDAPIVISDCGRLTLEPDEQITLTTPAGGQHDIARKSWGFYATASLNARLPSFGLRPVLAQGSGGSRCFLLLVERGQEQAFEQYLRDNAMTVLCWLDSDQALDTLERALRAAQP